ncbi:transporter substrate-binding domain-containing protein [Planococcus lenghuensis]|uniref:ABC transporter substrate-binding protein n=1 Tax=Planococcus lenghuensis TaxID=2213202 RepID=A0A1Q2L3M5_9BACL|nr:transporter substrate-binding domain-containing protein [Planococcus lenghuensis]AQQ54482.1 ABC transporter substrate-binding protein [Planococcus lenghuensis]
MKKTYPVLGMLVTASMILGACGEEEAGTEEEAIEEVEEIEGVEETEETEAVEGEEVAAADLNLVNPGQFTTASSGLYKPFNFTEDGELTGFDIAISKALAEEMGLEPNPVTTPWETIIQALMGEKFDAVVGSMAITDERAETVAFSDPYYLSGGKIFVAADNSEIAGPEDLEGTTIGVVAQSTYDEAAQQYTEDIQYYNSDVTALQDLTTGRLDAVITADIVGYEAMDAGLEIKDVGNNLWIEEAAVAVRQEDEALLEEVNRALDAIIEDGTYAEISEEWFGRNLLETETEGVEILR